MRILLVTVCLMFPHLAASQQFVTWNEQKIRLVEKLNPVVSHECIEPVVVAEVTIDDRGNVTRVKKRGLYKIPNRLWSQVASLVKKLRYRPLLVAGQPKPVKTIIRVPCLLQY